MTPTILRSTLEFLALGFAPPIKPGTPTAHRYCGTWRGRANLPATMNITGVDLRMHVRENARTSCIAQILWADQSSSRVRGRGFIYASGRCAKWDDDASTSRILVHTIAHLSVAAAQVTFDLYLPDGSELFGYATLRTGSQVLQPSF